MSELTYGCDAQADAEEPPSGYIAAYLAELEACGDAPISSSEWSTNSDAMDACRLMLIPNRTAELKAENARLERALRVANKLNQFLLSDHPRLSATWEHLPDVATPLPPDHSALFRAIRYS